MCIDIEHKQATEGLACVGGIEKHTHTCTVFDFDHQGATVSAIYYSKARGLLIIDPKIFIYKWKNMMQAFNCNDATCNTLPVVTKRLK